MILKEIPACRFVMVGRGDELAGLKEHAEKLNIAHKVTFGDFVEHEKVCQTLNTFDVYVNPSICKESFGVSVLEASACGIPTVAPNTGGIPEVCIDNRTGLLFDAGSAEGLSRAVIKILKNDATGKEYGENGRKMVLDRYDWPKCVEKKIALFESLIEGDHK
jgi:glycosyltransferase involved in cell wall biosynthesis